MELQVILDDSSEHDKKMAADCLRNMTVVLFGGQKFRGAYEDSVRGYEIT